MTIHDKQAVTYMNIGMIIGQVNRVEMEINGVIAARYVVGVGEANKDAFLKDILYSGIITLDSKLKLLTTIGKIYHYEMDKSVEDDLKRWKIIRNTVAHGIPGVDPNDGSAVVFYDGANHGVDKIREGFGKRQDRIIAYLKSLSNVIEKD